jgi:hypothetical protein
MQLFMNTETSTEKIVRLIENGDPVPSLTEDSLIEVFNELLKYGFIDVIEDRILVTVKGEEAKISGLNKVLNELKIQEELKDFSVEEQRKDSRLLKICLVLCVMVTGLFVVASVTNFSLNF